MGLAAGVSLFAWILRSSDLGAVAEMIRQMGWRFGMVLLFYAVIFGLDTFGWRFALHPSLQGRVRWDRLFRARLAGEALNYVTPSASIGGEPVKAVLLSRRHGIPMAEGMASVVVAKTTFAVSMLLFVALGLALTLATQPLPTPIMKWIWAILPMLGALMGLFLLAQFFQPFRRSASLLARLMPGRFAGDGARMREWDKAVTCLYRRSPGSLLWSLGFHFLGWVAGALEVYLILRLLQIPVGLGTAFSIEALWVLLRSGTFLIPGSIGASEGFLLLICGGVGVSAVAGLALGLVRRAREIAWMGLGLLEVAREA